MKNRNWAQPQFTGKTRPNSLFQIPPPIRAWSSKASGARSRRVDPFSLSLHCPQPPAVRQDAGEPKGLEASWHWGGSGTGPPPMAPDLEYLASICWGDLYFSPSLAALKRNMRQRRDGKGSDVSSEYSQHSGPGKGRRHCSQEMIIIQPTGIH